MGKMVAQKHISTLWWRLTPPRQDFLLLFHDQAFYLKCKGDEVWCLNGWSKVRGQNEMQSNNYTASSHGTTFVSLKTKCALEMSGFGSGGQFKLKKAT